MYALSKLLAELPLMLFFPMLMNVMLYFLVGFEDSFEVFFYFYLILMMLVQCSVAMGYFIGSIFRHEATAVAFAPIFNLPLTLLGGYMVSLKGIHSEWPQAAISWLTFISPIRWGFQGLCVAQFVPIATGTYSYGF